MKPLDRWKPKKKHGPPGRRKKGANAGCYQYENSRREKKNPRKSSDKGNEEKGKRQARKR